MKNLEARLKLLENRVKELERLLSDLREQRYAESLPPEASSR